MALSSRSLLRRATRGCLPAIGGHPARRRDAGAALPAVLLILLAVTGSSTSFIWYMNQQQSRAGVMLRSAAATALAEAGVHRALAILETAAPDGESPGRTWRGTYSEALRAGTLEGRFHVSLVDGPGGAIVVTSAGEVGGVRRRLRARVYLASPALLAAVYGTGAVVLEDPPAAVTLLPYRERAGDRPWVHIASADGVWFATASVSHSQPAAPGDAGPGPVDTPVAEDARAWRFRPAPMRILLARGAALMLDREGRRVDAQQLRAMGVNIDEDVVRTEGLAPPEVDRAYYQFLAAANTVNARINAAAGRHFEDRALAAKEDSFYTESEFDRVRAYLRTQPEPLQGVIFVRGEVMLFGDQHLQISDGALVADHTVHVGDDASLEVTHSAATRTLPGLIVLNNGALLVTEEARLRIHGLVFASRVFEVGKGAHVDIVGSVVGRDPGLSFQNGGVTVIRHDPAVMGTPGLRVSHDAPVVAWVASWEELP